MAWIATTPSDEDATIFMSGGRKPLTQKAYGHGASEPAPAFSPQPDPSSGMLRPPLPPGIGENAGAWSGSWDRQSIPAPVSDHRSALSSVCDVYGDNVALALATPIFDLLFRVQEESHVDVPALYQKLVAALRQYEARAVQKGLTPESIWVQLYGLAASADNMVLKSVWGSESAWAQKSLISLFFQETCGGERFFTLLTSMKSAPRSFAQEIELYYYCLQFGFQGRYRLEPQGAAELDCIREDLYAFLRRLRGQIPVELSPSWRGLNLAPRDRSEMIPDLLAFTGVILALVCVLAVLSSLLNRQTTFAEKELGDLVFASGVASAAKTVPVAVSTTVLAAPAAPPAPRPPEKLPELLRPEQQAGLIQVLEKNGKTVIMTTRELFASASVTLRDPYPDTFKAVAKALQLYPGLISIIGYSDNLPIHTPKFPNNIALSEARARVVANILAAGLTNAARVTSHGLGGANPIMPNMTPQGRQANRRIEITLTPSPASPQPPPRAFP